MTTLFDIAGIQARIFHLPGRPPFMISADLAEVYQTTPRRIGEAVKRNPTRFPARYAFRLSKAEEEQRWSQSATTSPGKRTDLEPLVFTHGGANMLASVLRGPVADQMAVAINDAFTEMEMRAIADVNNMLAKLRCDILARKPIYVKIVDAAARGLSVDDLRRETNYPGWKIEQAAREMFGMGMIETLLVGMTPDLFAEG